MLILLLTKPEKKIFALKKYKFYKIVTKVNQFLAWDCTKKVCAVKKQILRAK